MFLPNIFFQSDESQSEGKLEINENLCSNRSDLFQENYYFPLPDKFKNNTSSILEKEHINDSNILNLSNLSNMITNNKTFTVMRKNSKKGRKKKSNKEVYYNSPHDKYTTDNITIKLQIHYISFIIGLVNIILKELKCHEKNFFKIKYNYKNKVSRKNIEILKTLSIGDLLCKEISSKYLEEKQNHNIKLYNEIKDDQRISGLLSYKYFDLFNVYTDMQKDIFFSFGKIKINLKDYSIKTYKDLVNKNLNDPQFLEKLEETKEKYYKAFSKV